MAPGAGPSMVIRVSATLSELKKAMEEGRLIVDNTATSMGRLTSSLRGDKLLQDAQRVVQAVHEIGGASVLTEKQAARVNAQLKEAIDKYSRLGPEAQKSSQIAVKEMRELETATRKVEQPTGLLTQAIGKIGPMLLATFSAGALTSGARALVTWADDLDEVANGLDTNVVALQQFQYALNTTGSSSAAGVKAIQEMQKSLEANGDAVAKLGLNVDALTRMDSIARFYAITDALKDVTSEEDYARIGAEIFGKTWKSVSVSVKNDLHDVSKSVATLTGDEIAALARVQGLWDAALQRAKVAGARVLLQPWAFLPGGIAATNTYAQSKDYLASPDLPSVPGVAPRAIGKNFSALDPNSAFVERAERDTDARIREVLQAATKAAESLRDARVAALMAYDLWSAGIEYDLRMMGEAAAAAGAWVTSIPRGQMAAPLPSGLSGSSSVLDADVMQALAFQTWASGHGDVSKWKPKGGGWTALGGDVLASVPMLFQQAFTGGGGVSGALSAFATRGVGEVTSKALQDSIGKKLGDTIGKIIPGVGGLIGAGVGSLVDWIFGPSKSEQARAQANEQIDQLRGSLMQTYGSMDNLRKLSVQLGEDLAGAFETSDSTAGLANFQQILGRFNSGLEKSKQLIADLGKIKPGERLSDALRAQIGSGKLTDDARAAVGSFISGQTGTLMDTVAAYVQGGGSLSGNMGRGIASAASAAVGQARQNGISWVDLAATFAPTLNTISAGTGINNSLVNLVTTAGRPEINAILKSTDQVGTMVTTLDNIGRMDKETFGDLTSGLAASYQQLVAANVAADDAYRLMQPSLQQIWEVSKDSKIAADANMQAILDAAEAQGIIGDSFRSSEEQLKISIDNLISSNATLAAAISGSALPTVTVPMIPYNNPVDQPDVYGPDSGWAEGTGGYRWFGSGAGSWQRLHGWEAVVRPGDQAPPGLSTGGRRLEVTAPIVVNIGQRKLIELVTRAYAEELG